MNILITLDDNYVAPCTSMIHSILMSNPNSKFHFYVIYQHLTWENQQILSHYARDSKMTFIKFPEKLLKDCPTSKRYPSEMYFRLFAAELLPESLDRILYLDPDTIVINSLETFYHTDFKENIFIATTHVQEFFRKLNEHRLKLDENTPYINTGILLINLRELRKEHDREAINIYIEKNKLKLLLPDQDVFTAFYGNRTRLMDAARYNLGEKYLLTHKITGELNDTSLDWIRKNTVIIHYYGKNKPWKKDYKGQLGIFYQEVTNDML